MAEKSTETEVNAEVESAEVEEESTDVEAELEGSDESFEDSEDESEDTTEDEVASDTKSEAEEADKDESTEDSEDEATEEASEEEKQKQHNREMAEKRLKEKQVKEATLKQKQQEYLAEADKENPADLALRQVQVDAYNNKVDLNTGKLTNGYERAIKDFDILRDPDPAIQRRLDRALDSFQAAHVTFDEFGSPYEVREDIYAYLQTEADSITELTGKGARQQEKSKAKEKSKTLLTPNRAPKTPKKDPDIEGFDEEANRY